MNTQSIYLDNAATSFPKPEVVYQFADKFYRDWGANASRGQYRMAAEATKLIEETRSQLLTLYQCNNNQVLFTSSATEALNKILLGLAISDESSIYISPFEHNAVTRVVHAIGRSKKINIKLLPFDKKTLLFDREQATSYFENLRPDLVIVTHASNVCGAVLPLEEIFTCAKQYGAITVADMSQTFGLLDCHLSSNDIDYAVFAGHKSLLAPFGVGGIICKEDAQLSPITFGGTGHNSLEQGVPESLRDRIEVGSHNIYALAGLNAALNWITGQGLMRLRSLEQERTAILLNILRSYENIEIVADNAPCERIGVVSALFDNYSPDEIGRLLGDKGVAVRTGLHCSPYAHDFLGTSPNGTVRFSISCLTANEDFSVLKNALNFIRDNG